MESSVPIESAAFSALFAHHIRTVVGCGAKKQMIWSDAWWVIALVQYPHAVRHRSVVQFPRNVMGFSGCLLRRVLCQLLRMATCRQELRLSIASTLPSFVLSTKIS